MLAWAIPLLAGLALLGFGGADILDGVSRSPLPPFEVPKSVSGPKRIEVFLKDSAGNPAAGATLILLEPSVARATADAEGIARPAVLGEGPFRWMVTLPGHALLSGGPSAAFPDGGLRLHALREPVMEENQLRPSYSLLLSIMDAEGIPIPEALVVARDSGARRAAPSLGVSDANGRAALVGLGDGPHTLSFYAPGLPPLASWELLAVPAFDPSQTKTLEFRVPVCHFHLKGVSRGETLTAARLNPDAPLGLRISGTEEDVRFGPLPPGNYRFECMGETVVLAGKPGSVAVHSFGEVASPGL